MSDIQTYYLELTQQYPAGFEPNTEVERVSTLMLTEIADQWEYKPSNVIALIDLVRTGTPEAFPFDDTLRENKELVRSEEEMTDVYSYFAQLPVLTQALIILAEAEDHVTPESIEGARLFNPFPNPNTVMRIIASNNELSPGDNALEAWHTFLQLSLLQALTAVNAVPAEILQKIGPQGVSHYLEALISADPSLVDQIRTITEPLGLTTPSQEQVDQPHLGEIPDVGDVLMVEDLPLDVIEPTLLALATTLEIGIHGKYGHIPFDDVFDYLVDQEMFTASFARAHYDDINDFLRQIAEAALHHYVEIVETRTDRPLGSTKLNKLEFVMKQIAEDQPEFAVTQINLIIQHVQQRIRKIKSGAKT